MELYLELRIFRENHNDDYVYRLPYSSGSSFSVGQGYFGSFSHEGKYAIDWTMPIGTPIYAAGKEE